MLPSGITAAGGLRTGFPRSISTDVNVMTRTARQRITLSCKKATDVRFAPSSIRRVILHSKRREMMRSLALLACVLGSAALDACINPCPRRQLMTYVAHTQGGLTKGVDVAARVDADRRLAGGRQSHGRGRDET